METGNQRIRTVTAPPMKDIEDCLTYTKKLYDTFGHSKFSKAEIASTLGFSAVSGGFNYVLTSLRSFSFLTIERDGFLVSELFKRINASEKNSNDFKKLCFEALYSVPLYSELLNEFKLKIPPMQTVASRLEINKKMTATTARTVAKIFEDSLKFCGLLDSNNNVLPVREEINSDKIDTGQENFDDSKNDKNNDIKDEKLTPAKNDLILHIPLKEGRVAKIVYPYDITEDEATKISNVLSAITGIS